MCFDMAVDLITTNERRHHECKQFDKVAMRRLHDLPYIIGSKATLGRSLPRLNPRLGKIEDTQVSARMPVVFGEIYHAQPRNRCNEI